MELGRQRLILHVDVDAFFASVEQLLIPGLRGRCVVVGSGVIASCSYEARRFGLRAGMELHEAKRLCPTAVVLDGRYAIYRCFAEDVWRICRHYTIALQTYLDEAYGDATGMARIHGGPVELGRKLQAQVRRDVGLPVSVGLGPNRMLAKIASAAAKPGGVACFAPGQEDSLLSRLPVAKLPGVGPKTAEQLRDCNIRTIGELRRVDRSLLCAMFGRRGEQLYDRCRGRDDEALHPDGPPKSLSRETTFHEPQCNLDQIRGMLFYLLERAMRSARQAGLLAGRIDLSIRYDDWKQADARKSLDQPTDRDDEAFGAVLELLERLYRRRVALRHVGIVLSGFRRAAERPRLFEPAAEGRTRRLYGAIDAIRDRWGHAAVVSGKSIELLGRLEQNDCGFVLRTPSLTK